MRIPAVDCRPVIRYDERAVLYDRKYWGTICPAPASYMAEPGKALHEGGFFMHKLLAVILSLVLICSVAAALAETADV